jgi:hypothetical protein
LFGRDIGQPAFALAGDVARQKLDGLDIDRAAKPGGEATRAAQRSLVEPTSTIRSGCSAMTPSRFGVLPRPVRRPTSGRAQISGSMNSHSSGRLARGQPSSNSGANV